jgi:hypothetical protein
MQNIRIIEADLAQPTHQQATLDMVDAYSRDAMGDGKPLAANVRATAGLSTLNAQLSTSDLTPFALKSHQPLKKGRG